MSQQNPFTQQGPPVTRPTSGTSPKLLTGIGVLLLIGLMVCSGILWVGMERLAYTHTSADKDVEPYDMGSFEVVANAINGSKMAVLPHDASEIEATIQEIFDAIESGEIAVHLDADGYIAQMDRSGKYRRPDLIEVIQIKVDLESSMNFPDHYEHFSIQAIDSLSPDWAVVYMTTWDDQGWSYGVSQRWWMVRRDGLWKLADFQNLDDGESEAAGYATMFSLQDDRRIDEYYEFYSGLSELYGPLDDESLDRKIDKLSRTSVPTELKDEIFYDLAGACLYTDRVDRAEQAYQRIANPDRTPGTHLGLAQCAALNGNHQSVIDHTDRYLKLLGKSARASAMRAEALESLGETEKAIDELKVVLGIFTDHLPALWDLARLLPNDRASEITAIFPQGLDSEAILDASEYRYDRADARSMGIVADALEQNGESTAAHQLRGMQWQLLSEYKKASESLFLALSETERNDNDTVMRKYLDSMIEIGESVEGYERAREWGEALHYLVELISWRDQPTAEDMLRIAELHEKVTPGDPEMHYYRASALLEKQDLDGAIASLKRAKASEDSSEELERRVSNMLNQIAVLQNREIERYEESDGDRTVFLHLTRRLYGRREIGKLKQLVAKHLESQKADARTRQIEALVAAYDADFDRAISIIESIQPDEDGNDANSSGKIARLIVSRGDWQDYLRESSEQSALVSHLAGYFVRSDRWEELGELIQMCDELDVSTSTTDWLRIQLGVHQRDENAIATAAARSGEVIWEDYEYERIPWQIRSLVAMLRSERWDDAKRFSAHLEDHVYESIAPVLFHLQKGNTKDALSALRVLKEEGLLNELELYPDIVSPLWHVPEYATTAGEFRLRTLPQPVSENQFDLFYGADNAPSEDSVRDLLDERFGDRIEFDDCPLDHFDGAIVEFAMRMTCDDVRVVIVLAKSDARDNWKRNDDPLPEISDHTHCLSIAVLNPWDRFQPESQRLITEIADIVADENCLGAYCGWDEKFHCHPDQDLAMRLTGYRIAVPRSTLFSPLEPLSPWPQQRDVSRKLSEHEQSPVENARIRIAFDVGRARESLWLRVVGPAPDGEAGEELLCEFESESAILDFAKPGSQIVVPVGWIRQWE